jgi:hypothetical protein
MLKNWFIHRCSLSKSDDLIQFHHRFQINIPHQELELRGSKTPLMARVHDLSKIEYPCRCTQS